MLTQICIISLIFNLTLSRYSLSRGSFFSLRGTSSLARRRASVATRNAAPILHLVSQRASCIAGVHHYALLCSHGNVNRSGKRTPRGNESHARGFIVIVESGPSDPPSWQVNDLKSYVVVISLFQEILKIVECQKIRPIKTAKLARIYVTVSRWLN